ncbi:hypothetical protein SS1G_08905 [Sclerotinia sclerotiorum 1980 UF-70]|uniref:Amino acid transporter transmembrane domain-containing protein n=1 Tax=Sclerotinia sclerotiorum (strain ATCC 18683 / 1980 / Ss-1) TaxID=665079 RepID=A7EU98_SCLS1|nr:hypothetical protein SS1G_08905 [Sclerotinia sclerotiorum 1980 UF-70]EDN93040.1 hypothetical protein SS1G_08905 [Sclerotinia sclerotiorum 1980 UF-70]
MSQLLGFSQPEQARISQLSFTTARENSTPNNPSTPRASNLNSISVPIQEQEEIPNHDEDFPPRNPMRPSPARHVSYFSEDFTEESTLQSSTQYSASSTAGNPNNNNKHPYNNRHGTEDIEGQFKKIEESNYTTGTNTASQKPPGSTSEIHFRSMNWVQCSALMIAETISLGILALPSVLATIGLIPGILLILIMGILAWYSGYVMHQFRQAYPSIHSWADCCEILLTPLGWGRVGHEIAGAAQILFLLFLMGSHILTWIICLPFASITTAVLITMISVRIRAPPTKTYTLWPRAQLTLREAFLSITNIVFAYAGHIAFFTFISELRTPNDFPKALATLQIVEITLYLVTAIVIYVYAGSGVTSPALGSAGPGDFRMMNMRTKGSTLAWMGITFALWVVAWVIAESIPVFNELLGLVSSLFASWFTYGLAGVMWLFVHKGRWNEGWWMRGLFLCNVGLVSVGAVVCGMGLWASGVGIGEGARGGRSWSCGGD